MPVRQTHAVGRIRPICNGIKSSIATLPRRARIHGPCLLLKKIDNIEPCGSRSIVFEPWSTHGVSLAQLHLALI